MVLVNRLNQKYLWRVFWKNFKEKNYAQERQLPNSYKKIKQKFEMQLCRKLGVKKIKNIKTYRQFLRFIKSEEQERGGCKFPLTIYQNLILTHIKKKGFVSFRKQIFYRNRKGFERSMGKLIILGFVVRKKRRDENGRFLETQYTLFKINGKNVCDLKFTDTSIFLLLTFMPKKI